jgi:dolichyl-phosphate-mannose--protein O-mannosyl transferase
MATTDSTFTVVFDETKFVKGKQYAWTVYHGEDHPQQGTILRVFTFADDSWVGNFNKQLNEINKGESADMNKIKTIRLYLDNNVWPLAE